MNASVSYVIITPVRDEQDHLEKTIESVLSQTVLPEEWVLVNDGSKDGTGAIIDHYAGRYPWIRAVHRGNRGFRKAGGGVVEAFYDGHGALHAAGWDFIVKLDGDLSFPADYFEKCLRQFGLDPALGICGGTIYNLIDGRPVLEKQPVFHVRGATKIYRRACWQAIGGLIKAPGWDTLDEAKANMLGWSTKSIAELHVVHHRYTGSADGTWANAVKNGRANYITGYHPLFMLLKCVKRAAGRPYLLGSAGLMWGFLSGYLKGIPRVDDAELIGYIRRQQMNKLTLRPSIWR